MLDSFALNVYIVYKNTEIVWQACTNKHQFTQFQIENKKNIEENKLWSFSILIACCLAFVLNIQMLVCWWKKLKRINRTEKLEQVAKANKCNFTICC